MHSRTAITAVSLLLSAALPASAFHLFCFKDKLCGADKSPSFFNNVVKVGECKTVGFDNTCPSIDIRYQGPEDDDLIMVTFSSPDCNPNTLLNYYDEGCAPTDPLKPWKSMALWDVCEDEKNPGKKIPNCLQ